MEFSLGYWNVQLKTGETTRVSTQEGETSTASVNSPIINSQLSGKETISCCSSQTIEISSQELECYPKIVITEQECQTDGVFLPKDKYEELVLKASSYSNFKNDLNKLRPVISKQAQPEMWILMYLRSCAKMLVLINCIHAYKKQYC